MKWSLATCPQTIFLDFVSRRLNSAGVDRDPIDLLEAEDDVTLAASLSPNAILHLSIFCWALNLKRLSAFAHSRSWLPNILTVSCESSWGFMVSTESFHDLNSRVATSVGCLFGADRPFVPTVLQGGVLVSSCAMS